MATSPRISAGIGDTLALEFANTAGWHLDPAPVERLTTWRDLLRWAVEQGLVAPDQFDDLSGIAVDIGPALDLRERIFRVGLAISRGGEPDAGDVDAIVGQASVDLPAVRWSDGILSWRYSGDVVLPVLLGLVARDALALFTASRARKLRLCAGGNCGWLFIDESRGRPRRWCSMTDCGNRAKARRAYSRRKSGSIGDGDDTPAQ